MRFLLAITAAVLVISGFLHPLLALIPLGVGLIVGGIPWLILTIREHLSDKEN